MRPSKLRIFRNFNFAKFHLLRAVSRAAVLNRLLKIFPCHHRGPFFARRLGLPFTDSDQEIERRIGCSIRLFFEREGEVAFRDICKFCMMGSL